MVTLTWLHLSDWHQRGRDLEHNRQVVLDKLIEDIRERAERIDRSLAHIDFVVFSGDIAFSGQPAEYDAAWQHLLNPVLGAVGITPDRLFIVPGNHDMSRDYVYDMLPPQLQKPLETDTLVQKWLADEKRSRTLEPFEAYRAFVAKHTRQSNPDYASIQRLTVGDKQVALMGLNSSWMCGRHKDHKGEVYDARYLVVGEPQLHNALAKIADAEIKIAVIHHPFDWLADFDRNRIERLLTRECHFILRGHEHQPHVQVIVSSGTGGDCIIIPAGACYERRISEDPRYTNAYNWVHVDLAAGQGMVYLRRWSDPRSQWLEDIDTHQEGQCPFEITLQQGPTRRRPRDLSRPPLAIIEGARTKLYPEKPPERLIGRQTFLKEGCRRLLDEEFPLLVYGIPGIGKSAFLAALVNTPQVQEKYDNNIFWINLRGSPAVPIESEIADVIARGLRFYDVLEETIPEHKLRTLRAALSRELPNHLFVFDNADLSVHEGALLRIHHSVTSHIVVGSRTRFAIRDTMAIQLGELEPQYAIQMFKFLAMVDADDKRIAPICKLLGYHPLAITLSAPAIWMDKLTLEELGENLEYWKLDVLGRRVEYSEQDIRTSIGLSYDDLASRGERQVFDTMGAFALYGALLPDIARVTDIPNALCKQRLSRLKSRSLVQENDRDPLRYTLHPLLYEFARERLQERESLMISGGARFEETPTGRMIRFYVEYTKEHRDEFAALEAAHDNVIHAAEMAYKNKAWEDVYSLWEAADEWLDGTGDWTSMSSLQDWAVQANRTLENREIELANTLCSRSCYFDTIGRINDAIMNAEESLALGRRVGDAKTIAKGLVRLGFLYSAYLGLQAQAHAYFAEAWHICKNIIDWDESAYTSYQLGSSYRLRGDLTKAKDMFEKSIDICKRLPVQRTAVLYEAFSVTALGNMLVEEGKYEEARRRLENGLKLKSSDQYATAFSMKSLAALEGAVGNVDKAIILQNSALTIYKQFGASSGIVNTLREIGDTYCLDSRYIDAVTSYKEAATIGLRTDLTSEVGRALLGLGTAYYELGRYDDAIAVLRDATDSLLVAYKEELQMVNVLSQEDAHLKGAILHKMGMAYAALQRGSEAIKCLDQAIQSLTGAATPLEIVVVLETLERICKNTAGEEDRVAEVHTTIEKVLTDAAKSTKILTLDQLADYYINRDRLSDAETILAQTKTLLEQHQEGEPTEREIREVGLSYRGLGHAYERKDMYEEALAAYQQAAKLLESDSQTYSGLMRDIGDVYRTQHKLEQAVIYYEKAQEYKGDKRGLIFTLTNLADAHAELKQPDKALAVYKEALENLDSLYT